jgi:hypothetical protein
LRFGVIKIGWTAGRNREKNIKKVRQFFEAGATCSWRVSTPNVIHSKRCERRFELVRPESIGRPEHSEDYYEDRCVESLHNAYKPVWYSSVPSDEQ